MSKGKMNRLDFVKVAGATAAGVGTSVMFPGISRAQAPKTLKILQWSHFVPGYDK